MPGDAALENGEQKQAAGDGDDGGGHGESGEAEAGLRGQGGDDAVVDGDGGEADDHRRPGVFEGVEGGHGAPCSAL
jgi:hypothetical protein